jgi:peptide/nickel transport system permease protein
MTGYLLRRIGQALIVVVLVSLIVFVLLRLLPGGPARAILGPGATQEQVVQFNREQGFEQPIPLQYVSYAARVVRGDLGYSYRLNQNVVALITERLPKTLLLTILATLFGLLIALPLGIFQAVRRNKLVDYVATGVAFVLYAMPVFLLGLLLIIFFSQTLGILPPQAPQGSSIGEVLSQADGLVLPVLTLALLTVATFSRYARSSTLDNLGEDYVRTARAKGALEGRVLSKHVTRNALVPIVTLLGLYVPYLFGGSLVTEATFNYPGMGLLFWDAAQNRDYPILLGVVLVISVATVVGSLLADLAYAWLDPRVRFSSS